MAKVKNQNEEVTGIEETYEEVTEAEVEATEPENKKKFLGGKKTVKKVLSIAGAAALLVGGVIIGKGLKGSDSDSCESGEDSTDDVETTEF